MSGATGFIGRHLVYRLIERGDHVMALARNREKAGDLFGPHATVVTRLDDLPADTRIDAIVNLAGEPTAAGRWSGRRKARLIGSRLGVTQALVALVARLRSKPTTWINASAIGYYGTRTDDARLHEKSSPGSAFQSELCLRWEQAAEGAAEHGVKVAVLRIGLVLGGDGGALPALARTVQWGVGTVLGHGLQWVSWIHVDDLVELFLFVLDETTLGGPVNATAPTPARHAELMQALAVALGRRLLPIAVPAPVLRAMLGELAELFVDGQRVVPERATALGFRFRHTTVDSAIDDLLRNRPRGACGSAGSRCRSVPWLR